MSTDYFFNETAGCTGSDSGYDDTLDEDAASGGTKQDTIPVVSNRVGYKLTNEVGVPGLTTWDAGDYVAIVDVTERGNNIDMAALFRIVESDCTQTGITLGITSEVDPPQVGLNTLTLSSVAEQSRNSGDRLQLDLLIDNDHGHNSQTITVDYDDSKVTAPWTLGVTYRPRKKRLTLRRRR